MRWSDELWMYVGAVVLFGAVVLWGADVKAEVPAAIALGGISVMLLALWHARRTRMVLVVGPSRTEATDLVDEALDDAGYGVTSCEGPSMRPCPVESHLPCPIHQRVSGVVIVREAGDETALPECGRELGAPVVAVEGTGEGLRRFRASLAS